MPAPRPPRSARRSPAASPPSPLAAAARPLAAAPHQTAPTQHDAVSMIVISLQAILPRGKVHLLDELHVKAPRFPPLVGLAISGLCQAKPGRALLSTMMIYTQPCLAGMSFRVSMVRYGQSKALENTCSELRRASSSDWRSRSASSLSAAALLSWRLSSPTWRSHACTHAQIANSASQPFSHALIPRGIERKNFTKIFPLNTPEERSAVKTTSAA